MQLMDGSSKSDYEEQIEYLFIVSYKNAKASIIKAKISERSIAVLK